ncbi:MAG: hypothetical protein VX217_03330, partial [Acidobacteriota bacterium]|nr:hypothetical protein [Acidobacteriota bacterium]
MNKYPSMFGAKSQFLSTLLVASLLLLIAQPVLALAPETEKGMVSLTGSVYDNSGLPLIGALIAVALPGSDKLDGLTVSNTSGHFSV